MGFLLAKILFLLALATACGGLFSYWWFRRHYEDVTLEYTRSRTEWSAWRRSLEERLGARPQVDLAPLSLQLRAVEDAVRGLPQADGAAPGLLDRLAGLEALMRRLSERAPATDLTGIDKRLMAIEHALFPVQTRLDGLESAVRALPGAQADPAPLEGGAAAKPVVREGSRNLLTHPAPDQPDDLTRLRGVDKVLERTLHRVGVFYFWQIAEWSPEDVQYVDGQLPRFKGRIERDGWVEQAHQLAAEPDAAQPPTAH